jgi:hypothetical protein
MLSEVNRVDFSLYLSSLLILTISSSPIVPAFSVHSNSIVPTPLLTFKYFDNHLPSSIRNYKPIHFCIHFLGYNLLHCPRYLSYIEIRRQLRPSSSSLHLQPPSDPTPQQPTPNSNLASTTNDIDVIVSAIMEQREGMSPIVRDPHGTFRTDFRRSAPRHYHQL